MRYWKLSLASLALAICGAVGASSASAQVGVYYSSGYGVYGPSPIVYTPPVVVGPPMVVARPVIAPPVLVAPPVVAAPVVTAYRPVVPTYVAPVAAYSTYRPVYPVVPAPVYAAPVYGTAAIYRAGYVGPGLGGVPSVYTPGQPVRNALRYVVP